MLALVCRPRFSKHSIALTPRVLTCAFTTSVCASAAKSGSSQRWLRRQREDAYTRQATADGYRARSALKLCALDDKHRFLRAGAACVDCGASPGGWSQVAAERIAATTAADGAHASGVVVAVDLAPMQPLPGVHFVHGDFTEAAVQARVNAHLPGGQADVVLSDMAPAFSGKLTAASAISATELCEAAVAFAEQTLRKDGIFICKVHATRGFAMHWRPLKRRLRQQFRSVRVEKPAASRQASSESYLVCLGWKGVDA
ncbi:FtsJ-like methyltransferase-domain-containing protein [Thamnocephalis sphaerospora]|uniref:rRNA methyltransferase 2, mitochondrial n=1 Tax=Thamnocephalis sphaerospora TaxID=78915 RepID=A0A4P9XMG1_9FUNG|nr:FtsJ-like methyltransferase-domain-containing protein [Thamnocephalis sphaerospora]|eukprot:RKP07065.1 FtsJ-like methyltransferase-domain-containing protein [Thamnocephalis sphaerospora]